MKAEDEQSNEEGEMTKRGMKRRGETISRGKRSRREMTRREMGRG